MNTENMTNMMQGNMGEMMNGDMQSMMDGGMQDMMNNKNLNFDQMKEHMQEVHPDLTVQQLEEHYNNMHNTEGAKNTKNL